MNTIIRNGNVLVPPRRPTRSLCLLAFFSILLSAVSLTLLTDQALARAPDSFADLAEELLPSVVNISTTQTLEGGSGIEVPQLPPGSPFEEFFKEFMERTHPRQRQRRATSLGSGFLVDHDGHVVTNNHVIQDADEITIILADETRLPAKVVGRDSKTDIAVLKIEPTTRLKPARFGNSNSVRVGDWVLAIGNPFGFGGSVTAGIISARGRDINAGPYDDFLQTDASINRGNSGGPMFNLAGEVIGMSTAIFSPSGGSVGIGFAIPSNVVQPVINQLIKTGQVRRGWLGVRIQVITDEIAETLGLKSAQGALVASVIEGGPAQKSGIRAGDIIVEFNGVAIDQMRSLPRVVADTEVGKTVDVKLWRDNRMQTVRVTVGALDEGEERVASATSRTDAARGKDVIAPLGLTVANIDDGLRRQFSIETTTRGVVVTDVDPNGSAAEQGISPGNVIIEAGQQAVTSASQLSTLVKDAVAAGRKSILLRVEGDGGARFVVVRLSQG